MSSHNGCNNSNHIMSSSASSSAAVSSAGPIEHSDVDLEELESGSIGGEPVADEEELEEIRARVREMEEEAEKLKMMQDDISNSVNNNATGESPRVNDPPPDPASLTVEEKAEIDARSIYVGNVDYTATADDLEKHFHGCGSINRVTILCDKYTGHPKGFAYIEFAEKDSVETATALDESLFKGRQIKVNAKRTNRPGLSTTNRRPRGRGMHGRGSGGFGGRGGWGGGGGYGGYRARRPFRRGWHYSPY